QCALLFASPGAAAAAATQYRRADVALPSGLHTAVFDQPCAHANVLVAPVALRGDDLLPQLLRATTAAPHALWLLLNADLSAERAAVGMRESERRARFERSFELAFYFRNLFEVRRPSLRADEKGVLLFTFAHGWRAFALHPTRGYVLLAEWPSRPPLELLSRLLRDHERQVQRQLGARPTTDVDVHPVSLVAADARFVRVLALSTVLTAALAAALRLRHPL
ncbi:unnamed protein product, partial [Agarophyton chilense]